MPRRLSISAYWLVPVAICCLALLGALGLLLRTWYLAQREEALTIKRLTFVGVALLAYENEHGTLPPAHLVDRNGKPAHSWRVLILPYLGAEGLLAQYKFDEPWDSPDNLRLLPHGQPIYAGTDGEEGYTDIIAVVGSTTAWPGTFPAKLPGIERGRSTIILLIHSRKLAVRWTEPRDVTYEDLLGTIDAPGGIESLMEGSMFYVGADAVVRRLPRELTREELAHLLMIGEPHDSDLARKLHRL